MNLKDAIDTVVDYVRTQAPDDRRLLQALKRLEQRSERLRELKEARAAIIPRDLEDEPLTLGSREIALDLRGIICRACRCQKQRGASFCTNCYLELPAEIRKALWRHQFYEHAFCRALRLLVETREAVAA